MKQITIVPKKVNLYFHFINDLTFLKNFLFSFFLIVVLSSLNVINLDQFLNVIQLLSSVDYFKNNFFVNQILFQIEMNGLVKFLSLDFLEPSAFLGLVKKQPLRI